MKSFAKFVAALAIVGMIGATSAIAADAVAPEKPKAAKGEKKAKAPMVKGTIVKIDGASVTIMAGKKGEEKEMVVATDDKTAVMVEGAAAKVADLKVGQKVNVSPDTGTAAKIEVPAPKAPKAAK